MVLTICILLLFDIPYEAYDAGGQIINMFLAPATACLAVSIYTKIQLLKENWLPIVIGCACGSLASMGSIYLMCRLWGLCLLYTALLTAWVKVLRRLALTGEIRIMSASSRER